MQVRVYQNDTKKNLFKMIKQSIKDLSTSRYLAFQLAKRDISAQYRQSYLGIIWAFVLPITTALIWIILNSSGTVKLTTTGIPYPVYVFCGTLLWSILSESIQSPIKSTMASKSILTKINFPKEALITAGVLKQLFDTLIKVFLLIILVFIFGSSLSWSLLLFPFVVFGGLLVGNTIGLILTPIGMLYQDISKMIKFGMQFLMYATPVVYVVPSSGMMKTIMEYNPFTPIITVGRNLVVGSPPIYLEYFLLTIVISFPLFFVALVFYRLSIPIFVERLSA